MSVLATILLPTFGRADFVRWPLRSVQEQTISDIEIFVIGDGSAEETKEIIRASARKDKRIRFFDNPKGAGNGEWYRHQALLESSGKIICYIGHDDLWFPGHVADMLELLKNADFGHSVFTCVTSEGAVLGLTPLASERLCRSRMIRHRWNRFGPTCAAHTRDIYFKLPYGWRPAPDYLWSDLYMWRQFFELPGCRTAGLAKTTALFFPRSLRTEWVGDNRDNEISRWYDRICVPEERDKISAEAIQVAAIQSLHEVVNLENLIFSSLGQGPRNEKPIPSAGSLLLGRLLALLNRYSPRRLARLKERIAHEMIARSGLFNAQFYRGYYADIARDCDDLVRHFLQEGWKAAKHPSPDFDVTHYLLARPDVAKAGVNPLVHYLMYGYREKVQASKLFN